VKKIKIKIGDLFEKLNISDIDKLVKKDNIFIKTPSEELVEIRGFIKKSPKDIYEYEFSNGINIKCSDEHLFQEKGITKKARDCKFIDTINESIVKLKSTFLKKDYVFDISIDAPHLYVTPNGVIHHNTSVTNSIIKDLDADVMWINGSGNAGIDAFRGKVKDFISSVSIDDSPKIVVIDECLEENEKIKTSEDTSMALKDMEINKKYNCLSFNKNTQKIEHDTCEIISDEQKEVYKVEMNDGRTITVTGDHPFIINVDGKILKKSINQGLNEDDDIIDYNECVFDNNFATGEEVTVTIPKYQSDILKRSNINLDHLMRGFLDVVIEEQIIKENKA